MFSCDNLIFNDLTHGTRTSVQRSAKTKCSSFSGFRGLILIWIFFSLSIQLVKAQTPQYGSEEELKKQAAQYFDDEEYAKGYKAYSQLVSNYPKDPNYNYRLGVCMLYSEPDKKKCYPYLEFANKNIKDCEKEAKFYLAKAYHANFRFDDALKLYAEYKAIASGGMIKKLQVDMEMQACKNGKRLLSNLNELVVLEKKQMAESDYFRSYNLKDIGGKLLVKPNDYMTAADKKKKNKSIVYLPRSNDQLYYSSYGSGDNKDIYIVRKLPNGEWSKPQNMGAPINTEFDEDYPFLHPNGKVLYFASKGHNSMGGYDLFKSVFDEVTRTWGKPENLDFPINTPNDDILFVTDSLEKTAYFSSTRQSPYGKIDVYKINTERRAPEFIYIKGTVLKQNESMSVLSKISIKDINAGENVGSFPAANDGNYLLKIPNGGKFIFTVETPGFPTQSEGIDIPVNNSLLPYRQSITYKDQTLVIKNFFKTNPGDENAYKDYIEIFEEKSKMDVNASDFPAPTNTVTANSGNPKNNTGNTNTTGNPNTNGGNNPNTNPNLSNQQLEKIAFDDAKELQEDAVKLKSDANDAFTFVNNEKIEADQKEKEALQAIETANRENDPLKKEPLLNKAEDLKEEAQKIKDQAALAENIAKQLDQDANNKQKEADLQQKYAEQLKEVNKSKNNKEALAKLEAIQKELEQVSNAPKNTTNLAASLRNEATRKNDEVQKLEPGLNKIKNEIADLNKEMSDVDKEIGSTKDKQLLENLKTQKADLAGEINQKNADLAKTQDKINMLKKDSEALNSQADFASNMLTEVKDSGNLTPIANNSPGNTSGTNSTSNLQHSNTGTLTAIQKDQKTLDDATAILNKQPESSSRYAEQNKLIDNYVTAIDKQLQTEKNDLKKAKTPAEKTTINNHIKELETLKKEKQEEKNSNESKIAYFKNIENNSTASNNNTGNNTGNTNNTNSNSGNPNTNSTNTNAGNPLSSDFGAPDLNTLNQLGSLADSFINPEEQALFSESTFGNPAAMTLKTKAESEYNSAIADAKNTADKINAAKTNLQNGGAAKNTEQINQLNTEADRMYAEATDLRKQAGKLSGDAKKENLAKVKELESIAAGKKYEAALLTSKDNESKYAQNEKLINEYLQANSSGNSAVVTKAGMLVNEAKTMYNQAMRIKEEANAEPDVAAKYSSYSNVEDKELQSLKKQEDALALLRKNNPAFKPSSQNTVSETDIAVIKNELSREEETKIKALEELAQSNKQEYAFVMKRLKENEAKPKGTSPGIQQKEQQAMSVYNEGNNLLNSSVNAGSTKERAAMLVNANKKLKAAIDKTNEAYAESKQLQAGGNNVAANNTNPSGNNAGNTTTNNSGNNTGNTTGNTTASNNTGTSTTGNNTNTNSSGNTVTTNTFTPNSKLTEAQVKSVQATPEYKNYTMLSQEVDKYEAVADKESQKANGFYEEATKNLKASNDVRIQLDKLPPGDERNQKQKQAAELDRLANVYKTKGDSVMELAANTKSFADSKKMEMEAYEQSLDPKTLENIRIASGKQANNPAGNATTNSGDNTTTVPPAKYAEYSPAFRESATNYDKELEGFATAESNESNLNAQNTTLTNYNKAIDTEIAADKKKLATANAADKTKINQRITALQNQKTANNKVINANTTKLKALTQPTANNNTGNNTSGNNTNNSGNNTASNNTNNSGNNAGNNTANNTTSNSGNSTGNTTGNTTASNNTGNTNSGTAVSAAGISVKNSNAYSSSNPIPIDDQLPPGIIFAVQIGAFKNPIPDDLFKGLSPLRGERTSTGFIRYQAGRFEKFDNANAVRNDLKKLGYKDAFVVVYKNGQRFSLAEAIKELKNQGIPVNNDPNESAGITVNSNVPTANAIANTLGTATNTITPAVTNNTATPTANNNSTPVLVNPTELNDMQGMLFTVQVGVYASQVNSGQLLNLKPIYRERLPNGQYRYTAGIYNNINHVKTDRAKVNTLGIGDAFVSAYQNGQRIKIADALNQIASGANIQFPPENPIQFGDATAAPTNTIAPVTNTVTPTNTDNNSTVAPFNNGITQGPQPTAENGVKVGDDGITFKVQIGAYKNQVPQAVATNFLKIKNWPIVANQVNGLYIYTVGSYMEAKFARSLVEEARTSGVIDAFITVYKDGKKLYGAEASTYLNR